MKRAADLYETQQAMLVFLAAVLLFVLGMLGALSWVIIAITFLVLRLTNCSTVTALYVAGFAVTIGMILYRDWTAWFAAPMALMQTIITPYINEGLVRLILNEEHMAMMVSDMTHYFVAWARSPMTWLYCMPAGVFSGSLLYVGLGLIWKRPLGQIKRRSENRKNFGKVGDLSVRMVNKRPAAQAEGALLGVGHGFKSVVLSDKAASEHTLVTGTTGSGKTVSVCNIVESAISRGVPVIYVDGKGDYDLARRIARFGQDCERVSYVFAMSGESCAYNPLASGGFTSKKDRIIALRSWSEEHYKKLAEGYLQCVFKVMEACDVPCNLTSLSNYMDYSALKTLLRIHKANVADWQKLNAEINEQEAASQHVESLMAEIRNFTASELEDLFEVDGARPVMTLDSVLEDKGCVYFCLPALAFPTMAATLGRLVVNDIKATLAARMAEGRRQDVYVVFDEFSVFAGDQVLNIVNMGRSAGAHVVLATQSLSDIAAGRHESGDHFINQVVGNCNNFIIHRQNSAHDAELLAALIGTHPEFEYTAQVSDLYTTHMGTVRPTRGFIAHPDEIKSLHTGEAFYYSKLAEQVVKMKARMSWV